MAGKMAASRKYDHVYDPTYIVSSAKDHYRTVRAAAFGGVERVADSRNMFSDVSGYPRHTYRFSAKSDLPAHVSQRYRPGGGGGGGGGAAGMHSKPVDISRDRHLFFKRPVVPYLQAMPPEVVLASAAPAGGAVAAAAHGPGAAAASREASRRGEGKREEGGAGADSKRTVGVQTMYRDSEAQTDPYTPDFTVRPGDEPEVLTLATLTHDHGLPAGLAQVQMIERARKKREFEASLPPATDEASFELRRRMLEEQEIREWRERELEIEKLQDARLKLLQAAILERDRENAYVAEQRIEALRQRKLEDKERAIAAIQARRIKELRKLAKARKRVGAPRRKRDIIEEYADFGSRVYAPIKREGQHADRTHATDGGAGATLERVEGVAELEATLPAAAMTMKSTAAVMAERGDRHKAARNRKKALITKQLAVMDDLIRTRKMEATGELPSSSKKLSPSWRRKQERTVRPPTPSVAVDDDSDRELDNAVVLLQRLLRGRAVQNMMFEGKEKRLDLIRELKLEADSAVLPEPMAAGESVDDMVSAALDAMQGEVISSTLDFLAKEAVRRDEEAAIAAFVHRAEDGRRLREAEETGRRHAEKQLRARQDAVYRQVMRVHTETASSYLNDLLSGTMSTMAMEKASAEAAGGPVAGAAADEPPKDVVVRDLVASFLLPEVERQRVKEQLAVEEKRFVDAAHRSIYSVVRNVEAALDEDPEEGGLL
eukprot:PLAT5336.4.p1 GENE.PLAT5336.4~~PLAT5336.4.p1  ORF type:complete len:717 (+),score=376.62 PLAT5336.4:82-2232(+)